MITTYVGYLRVHNPLYRAASNGDAVAMDKLRALRNQYPALASQWSRVQQRKNYEAAQKQRQREDAARARKTKREYAAVDARLQREAKQRTAQAARDAKRYQQATAGEAKEYPLSDWEQLARAMANAPRTTVTIGDVSKKSGADQARIGKAIGASFREASDPVRQAHYKALRREEVVQLQARALRADYQQRHAPDRRVYNKWHAEFVKYSSEHTAAAKAAIAEETAKAKKAVAAQTRQEAKKTAKLAKKKSTGPSSHERLIAAQRAYRDQPNATNLQRVRQAQRVYYAEHPKTALTPLTRDQREQVEEARLVRKRENFERGQQTARARSQRKPRQSRERKEPRELQKRRQREAASHPGRKAYYDRYR